MPTCTVTSCYHVCILLLQDWYAAPPKCMLGHVNFRLCVLTHSAEHFRVQLHESFFDLVSLYRPTLITIIHIAVYIPALPQLYRPLYNV
jgi:hypothetical protein